MAVSSAVVWLAILEIVGASFTLVTVNVKVLLEVSDPSLTVIVTFAEPKALAAGVKVAERLAPVPLKTMLATGKIVVSEEVAESIKLARGVSTSPIVNETDVWVSS